MLFSSIVFLFYFFPVVLLGYCLLSFSRAAQNFWLFLASILFYAWGEPVNVFLMIGSILLNAGAGWLIGKDEKRNGISRAVLIIAIFVNIGMLFLFKYTRFLVENINTLSGHDLFALPNIALPIGISFFTFQSLSYVIDVYRGNAKAEKNPFHVGLYIAFFPQLIAGPIVKYSDIAEQIKKRVSNWEIISSGICRFVLGLGKKVLLANHFAVIADNVFNWSTIGRELFQVPAMLAWLGAISYTLQIYFDFSAYSDMAIGLGRVFGFTFAENFNEPYISRSMTEFWRRWHISLTSWFREYVYFPLGGSRVTNKDIMVRNLFVVWLLTGIWHGANWTFVIWGMWNFLFTLVERFFRYHESKNHILLQHCYTMLVVVFGWVLFRADDLYQAGRYVLNMFGRNNNGFYSATAWMFLREYWLWLLLGIVFCFPAAWLGAIAKRCAPGKAGFILKVIYPVAMTGLFALCVAYLARGAYNPFIYFNF